MLPMQQNTTDLVGTEANQRIFVVRIGPMNWPGEKESGSLLCCFFVLSGGCRRSSNK